MKRTLQLGILSILIAFTFKTQAQIAGSFTVPLDFPNMAAAINTLNVMGVAGPVTICVNAGYTETVAVGGLKLFNVPGASAANTIIFQKNGSGANPVLMAYSGGVGTPTTAIQDGVWWLIGADYITIDGINILDPNTSNPSTMEFGYGMYNASTSNGCQYNTIKNCVVTLNRINASMGAGLNAGGSRAIESVCASYTQNVTTYLPTSAAGTHSYNKFYSNLIQNCHNGITLMGYQSTSPYTLSDKQNDVGGTSAVTGNTVINFGGGLGSDVSGIRTKAQYSLSISYNSIKNNTGTGIDPTNDLHAINLGVATGGSTSVNGNTITLSVAATNSIDVYGIRNSYGSTSATVQIVNNVFPSCSFTGSNGTIFMIYDYSSSALVNISSNLFQNTIGPPDSRTARIIETHYSSTCTVNSNTVTNFTSQGTLYGILSGDHTKLLISNNSIENIYAGRSVEAITHSWGSTAGSSTISLNSIGNFTTAEGVGISAGSFSVTKTISGNTICNVFSPPTTSIAMNFSAIDVRGGSATITANAIHTFTGAAATATYNFQKVAGIGLESVSSALIERNKIGSLTYVGRGSVQGIYLLTSYGHTVTHNVIGDLNNTKSNRSDGLVGIYVDQSANINNVYYYNTVYLNSASTSTDNFGSAAMILPSSASITVRNNILVNTSVSTGTGVTTVIRKPNSTLSDYSTTSNNNIFYAGPPASNRYIYHDGVNTFTTLADFKAYATPRESQSYSENPPFITTNGSMSNFLSMDPALPTLAEGTAIPIAGFTVDYAGTTRNATTPDVGAWEGTFLQADVQIPTINISGFTTPACDLSGRTLTLNISDATGVASGSLSPRMFYRRNFGLYASTQGSLSSGTYSNGVWSFSITYAGVPGDIVRYFFTMQDISSLNNLALIPSTGGSIISVNNVPIPPTTTFTYALESPPTVSITSGNICSGSNFTITPSGAQSYTITGGSFTVSPSSNTSYSITGTSTAGCVSSNTAIASVSVITSPTLTVNSGSICSGNSFTLNASGADTYTYSGGASIVSPLTNTFYTVTGTNTLGGCISAPITATVNVFVTPTISVNSGSICAGTIFTLVPTGASAYTISGGSTTVSPPTNSLYLVTGISTAGCTSANTATSNITVAPLPTISVNSGSICSGKSFSIASTGASMYVYSGGSAVVSPLSNTVYAVSGTSSLGCLSSNTAVASVTVESSPTITVNSGSICAGQSFSLVPSNSSLSYTYSGGSAFVSPPTTSVFAIVGTNSLGCTSNTASSNVTVSPNPTITVNNGSICFGNSFTLVPSGASSYVISGGTATVSPATNTVFLVSGTSTAGCASVNSATSTITVAPLPTVSIANGTVCSGKNFTLAASGASNYVYSGGSAIVSPATNTFYTVTGTSSLGCLSSNTATANITVNTSPSISVNSGSLCAGQSFTLVPTGVSLTYTYSSGTAIVSPGTTTLYTVAGTNSLGCVSNSGTSNVIVVANPTVSVNSGTLCSGSVFTILPSGAATYSIAGGTATVSPSSSTTYTVTGINTQGCASANTATASITVSALPSVTLSSGSVCSGDIFTLTPSGAATYIYSSGFATVSPAITSTYAVSGISASGCASSNTAIATVSVQALPSLSISGTTLTCAGLTQTLTASGANTYTWMATTNALAFVVSPTTVSTYSVLGANANGCINSTQITIHVNALPAITINGNFTVCAGTIANLSAFGGALTYTWSNGTIGNLASYSLSASAIITATATGVNTCINTATQVIFVNSLPPVAANADNSSICIGGSLTLSGSGAATYTWSGGVTNNSSFYPSSTSSYTVSGTDASGCKNSATIQIVVNPLPSVIILNSGSDTICSGETVQLTATGANIYNWSNGATFNIISLAPGITATHSVVGTDANGCFATAAYQVVAEECLGLNKNNKSSLQINIYPNPNNGSFVITVNVLGKSELRLYSTLGELIFEQHDVFGNETIQIPHIANGVYFAEVKSNNRVIGVMKVVKQ